MQANVTDHRTEVAILHLQGELDTDTAQVLYAALDGLLMREVPRVVVDLAGLRFCDSVGLGVFISTYMGVTERGGWLRIAAPNPFLRRLIDTVGLTRYISVYDTVEQAVDADAA